MIRYKVVNRNRGSCVVPPQNHKYYRIYKKGWTIYAEEDSFGLTVFDTLAAAERFNPRNAILKPLQILKVKPIGKQLKAPSFLFYIKSLTKKYRLFSKYGWNKRHIGFGSYPNGTLFYRAVKVLD